VFNLHPSESCVNAIPPYQPADRRKSSKSFLPPYQPKKRASSTVSVESVFSKQAEGLSESSRWSKPGGDHRRDDEDRSTPKGVPEHSAIHGFCDPFRVGILTDYYRWCRSAQPPATFYQPFGLWTLAKVHGVLVEADVPLWRRLPFRAVWPGALIFSPACFCPPPSSFFYI